MNDGTGRLRFFWICSSIPNQRATGLDKRTSLGFGAASRTSPTQQRGMRQTNPGDDGSEGWRDHVAEAQKLVAGRISLGQRPADLPRVLALVALGGPATVALRALSRVSGGAKSLRSARLEERGRCRRMGFSVALQPARGHGDDPSDQRRRAILVESD